MRYSIRLAMVSIFVFAMLSGCRELYAMGSIKLAENADGGGRTCTIPFPDPDPAGKKHYYNLWDMNAVGCHDDVYSYFLLSNAPSVAKVEFNSDYGCKRSGSTHNEWWYDIETYKHNMTTGWISIASLNGVEVGEIVKAGVKLIVKHHDFGDIEAELECLTIRVSPLP